MDPYRKGYGTPPPPRKLDLGALAVRPLVWAVRLVRWALRLAFDFLPLVTAAIAGVSVAGKSWNTWYATVSVAGLLGAFVFAFGMSAINGVGTYHTSWWRAGRAIYRAAKRPVWKEE